MDTAKAFPTLAVVLALCGCVHQPPPPPAPLRPPVAATASAGTATTASQTDKLTIPPGYKHRIVNGQDRYCIKDRVTGSLVQSSYICLTADQLQQQHRQDVINDVQRQAGFGAGNPAPTGGK